MAKQEALLKLNDRLLTALAILLSLFLFVIAPLQANGVISGTQFGLIFGVVLIPAAFMVSGNTLAVGAILVALALVFAAAIRQAHSLIDILTRWRG